MKEWESQIVVSEKSARACLRDVLALSTLPALWFGAELERLAESLATALEATLEPDFVYVLLQQNHFIQAEVARSTRHPMDPEFASRVGDTIREWAIHNDLEPVSYTHLTLPTTERV